MAISTHARPSARSLAICLMLASGSWADDGAKGGLPSELKQRVATTAVVRNNFCWELLSISLDKRSGEQQFTLPVDRWVFVRCESQIVGAGRIKLFLDDGDESVVDLQNDGIGEAMRYLKAGVHRLRYSLVGEGARAEVSVRGVPAIHHAYYGSTESAISPYGPYDWAFLEKNVNPHVNVMIDNAYDRFPVPEHVEAWTKSGRRWISKCPTLWDIDPKMTGEPDRLQKFWENSLGVRAPLSQGILIDEIGEHNATYDLYREVGERLYDGSLKGRTMNIYSYGHGLAESEEGRRFGKWIIERGGDLVVELYVLDTPDLPTTEQKIKAELIGGMEKWAAAFPPNHLVVTLAGENQPTDNGNRCPQTDFNVLLDMQMHALANDPALFGLGGVQFYYCGYSDEEALRWMGKLFRHYCLEGSRERLTKDPYELPHIQNPDFANDEKGWKIEAAETDSIAVKSFEGHGTLQGRWGGSQTGDKFMTMRRNAGKPNKVRQTIKGLTPGRYYSVKMLSGDYEDLIEGRSINKAPAVFVNLENAELMEARRESFVYPYPHSFSRTQGEFSPKHQYWNNYHWQVFRALATTVELTISDWKDEIVPGGPIGQQTAFNFVEVQPFLKD